MKNAGYAHMGVGRAKGADKAQLAAMAAISSPLLETSIAGATGVLVSITASEDIQLDEVETASQMIHEEAHPDATIIWGAAFDPTLVDEIKVTIIATGFIDNNGRANETVRKVVEAPVVTTPASEPEVTVQPVVDVHTPVAPVVTPVAAPVVEEPKVEPTPVATPAKSPLEESIKKADDMLSLLDRYNEDFVFITKKKQ
jgi:cell division protein FtsZ